MSKSSLKNEIDNAASPIGVDALIMQVPDRDVQAVIDFLKDWEKNGCKNPTLPNAFLYSHIPSNVGSTAFINKFKRLTGQTLQDYTSIMWGNVYARVDKALKLALTPSFVSGLSATGAHLTQSYVSRLAKVLQTSEAMLNSTTQNIYGHSIIAHLTKIKNKEPIVPLATAEL